MKVNAETHIFSKEVEAEISDKIEAFGEPSDINDFTTLTRMEALKELLLDSEEEGHMLYGFAKKELRQFQIDVGIYREITKEDMDRITVFSSSGRRHKKYDFKQDGKFWAFESWKALEPKKEGTV